MTIAVSCYSWLVAYLLLWYIYIWKCINWSRFVQLWITYYLHFIVGSLMFWRESKLVVWLLGEFSGKLTCKSFALTLLLFESESACISPRELGAEISNWTRCRSTIFTGNCFMDLLLLYKFRNQRGRLDQYWIFTDICEVAYYNVTRSWFSIQCTDWFNSFTPTDF